MLNADHSPRLSLPLALPTADQPPELVHEARRLLQLSQADAVPVVAQDDFWLVTRVQSHCISRPFTSLVWLSCW